MSIKYTDFGPLQKVHPREMLVNKAKMELANHLLQWSQDNSDLTYAEKLYLLNRDIHETLLSIIWIERRKKDDNEDL